MTEARPDGRAAHQMRPVSINAGVNPYAEGSAICAFGATQVLCTASLESGSPRWMGPEPERGWVTAEYALLPRSTHTRTKRDHQSGGRAQEISRLIGRSLRAAVDLTKLVGWTIRIDCDVLVADGGTRTAAISGGWVALAQTLAGLGVEPLMQVAALSLGRVNGCLLTDLCDAEDSAAEVDLNLVLGPAARVIEMQATAEQGFMRPDELNQLLEMGLAAGEEVFAAQRRALGYC